MNEEQIESTTRMILLAMKDIVITEALQAYHRKATAEEIQESSRKQSLERLSISAKSFVYTYGVIKRELNKIYGAEKR